MSAFEFVGFVVVVAVIVALVRRAVALAARRMAVRRYDWASVPVGYAVRVAPSTWGVRLPSAVVVASSREEALAGAAALTRAVSS